MENTSWLELSPIELATASSAVAFFLCFIAKAICLIWAFVRTQKPAALVYLAFIFVSGFLPAILSRILGVEDFAWFMILYNGGSALIETGLFIWLVRSLLKRHTPSIQSSQDSL